MRVSPVICSGVLTVIGTFGCTGDRQRTFSNPEQATDALIDAYVNDDKLALAQILGPEAEQLAAEDESLADFVAAYDHRHDFSYFADGSVRVLVGDEGWPMPIPLVRKDGGWVFSASDGVEEVAARTIGENELGAIQVCLAIVDAQREYAFRDPDADGLPDYAQRFLSDPGEKNGLYWAATRGETPPPLGPAVVNATPDAFRLSFASNPKPYHGYYYRLLTAQGPHAAGGERDYRIDGRLIGGFAVVAWPAIFGTTGLSTFLVDQNGEVYQAYLGPSTAAAARSMTAFDPSPVWSKLDPALIATERFVESSVAAQP
jgi:hypothetical protein